MASVIKEHEKALFELLRNEGLTYDESMRGVREFNKTFKERMPCRAY